MAMLQQIDPTKFCPQAHQHNTEKTTSEDMTDPHPSITIKTGITTMTVEIGTGSADVNPPPTIPDIGVTIAVTLTEVTLDPITDPHLAAHHATQAQAHTDTDETLHTAGPHHAGVSPEITSNSLENQRQEIQASHH